MFEKETEHVVYERMLRNTPNNIDKREGSIAFDLLAPVSIEAMLLYAALDYFLKNTFADTAEREFLIARAKERGIEPTVATFAEVKGIFEPASLPIEIGARFSYEDINFIVIDKLADGEYILRGETAGTVGNLAQGNLVPIDFIKRLQRAYIDGVIVPGEDEEDTETFRKRYLRSFNNNAYGGNIDDYKEKVGKVDGVGGVKVYPVWKGGGTVKVVFSTSDNTPPVEEFVKKVQEMIDPVPHNGLGIGIAPIGHTVTVVGVTTKKIDIKAKFTFTSGSLDKYKSTIESVLLKHFAELNAGWEVTQKVSIDGIFNNGLIVRLARIESALLDIAGVVDVENLTINGKRENYELDKDELPVLGVVSSA